MSSDNQAASRIILSHFDEAIVREALEECRSKFVGRPTIAFVFFSADWSAHAEELVELIQVYGHAEHVVGCSADGFIGTDQEDEGTSGCSLLLMELPHTEVEVFGFTEQEAADLDMEGKTKDGASWILLKNPAQLHAEEWIVRWNEAVNQAPTFGGLASGGHPEDFTVLRNGQTRNLACVAVRLHGGIRVEGVVSQGCRPIGDPFTITQVDDNQVIKIASQKAFEVLENAVMDLSPPERLAAQGNLFVGLAMNEYVEEFSRGDFLVRNILGGDPQSGILAVGAYPRTGQTIQFQIRDRDTADEDMRTLCEKKMRESGSPFGGLLFSCTGRGSRMFGVPNHDAGIIADTFGRIPMSGFFCNGEIGPIGDSNYLHGYTASTAFFYHA